MGGDRLGRGVRPGRRRPGQGHQRPRPRRRRRLPRQPERPQPRLDDPPGDHGQDAAHPQPVQRDLGGPAAPPAGGAPAVRPSADAPDPRHRPHRLLPGVRSQPDGLQRLPDDRPGLPEPAPRAQGPRRKNGRVRPAANRDRQGGDRAPLRQTRHRRLRPARDAPRAVRGGPHQPAVVRRPAGRGRLEGPAEFTPERGRAGERRTGRRDPPDRPASTPPPTRLRRTAGSACRPPPGARSPNGRCSCSTW